MTYDDQLAERVRKNLEWNKGVTEQKMFGGLSFHLHGKMCCGVLKDDLIVRVQPQNYEAALQEPFVRPMDFTGRPLKGFLYVSIEGCQTERELSRWIEYGIEFVSTVSKSDGMQSDTKKRKKVK
jgi:TfoX/Sxy family transcriptional regulator of competence genes